jgi:hypothetical protein
MNDLSWLIYFAGVTGNIQGLFVIGGIIALIIMGIAFIILSMGVSEGYYDVDEKEFLNKQRSLLLKWLAVPVTALLISCFLPSSGTVYAIAASEMGEEFAQSETFNKAEAALNAWLDRQLAPAPAAAVTDEN